MYHWMAQDGGAAVMPLLVHYAIAGLVSGATFIASDVAAQVFLRKSARLKWPHLLRIGIFGLAIKGPLQSIYYDGVEAVSPGRGSASMVGDKITKPLHRRRCRYLTTCLIRLNIACMPTAFAGLGEDAGRSILFLSPRQCLVSFLHATAGGQDCQSCVEASRSRDSIGPKGGHEVLDCGALRELLRYFERV